MLGDEIHKHHCSPARQRRGLKRRRESRLLQGRLHQSVSEPSIASFGKQSVRMLFACRYGVVPGSKLDTFSSMQIIVCAVELNDAVS